MRQLLILLFLFLLASCRHLSVQQDASAPAPQKSTCHLRWTDSLSTGMRFHVMDGDAKEDLPFAIFLLRDSIGNNIGGGQTDFEGHAHLDALPVSKFSLKISAIGYMAVEVLNIRPQAGKGLDVDATLFVNPNDTIWFEPWPLEPSPRDPFAPQNQTYEREDIRRRPTPR